MGRLIRSQKKGRPDSIYKAKTFHRVSAAKYRTLDFSERKGYVKGIVKEIIHDPGRGAPLARVQFKDLYSYKTIDQYYIAVEGMYSG